jgi:flagellar motility protein MotE (MotC chaperone)
MWKVSFTPLLIGFVCALACSMSPQGVQARDGDVPGVTSPAAQRPAPHLAKHTRSGADKRLVAAMQDDNAAPTAPGRPDITTGPNPPAQSGETRDGVADQKPASPEKPTAESVVKPKPMAAGLVPHEIQLFCANTASAAVDARVAWQAAKLVELEAKLRQRIAEFEVKRAEYEDWLRKHDDAMKVAKDDVVAIYSRMRPDAAASQLAVMDDVMAASLLAKLNSRIASAILAEMDPGRAARIANAMVGPVNTASGKKS